MGGLGNAGTVFHRERVIPSRKPSFLISRIAVYAIRTYGGVGGLLSNGESYPVSHPNMKVLVLSQLRGDDDQQSTKQHFR